MVKNLYIFLHVFLLLSTWVQYIDAIKYTVTNNVPNTPGGKVFDTEVGADFAIKTMQNITNFIFKVFRQPKPEQRKNVSVVNFYLSDFKGYAYTYGENINLSGPSVNDFWNPRNQSRFFFSAVMYHEMTHVFQYGGGSGSQAAPDGLLEGIADYVMVKSGVYEKEKFAKPGSGKRWDEGYGFTERFLEYCDSLKKGFTATLNNKMRYVYSDDYFKELLGKSVDQLWKDYKDKYGNLPEEASDSDVGYGRFPGRM